MLEQAILGHILLINPKDIVRVKAEYFTNYNFVIAKKMKELDAEGNNIDQLHLIDQGIDVVELTKCTDVASSMLINDSHFNKLIELYETRTVREYFSNNLTNKSLNAVQVGQQILDLAESNETYNDHIDHVIDSFMADLVKPKEKEHDYYRYDNGLNFLNQVLGTLRKGELNLVGARSGVGKTLFVMQNLSKWSEHLTTLFISREMRSESLWKRILVRETGIDNECFREKRFTQDQVNAIKTVNKMFKGRRLFLNAQISTVSEIRRKLYETKAQLLVVDYLQIMESEGQHNSREREVAWISRQLKRIALEFDIPVVVLSQLNDNAGEFRPTGERDIRESKAPYQDSDNVIFLHKPGANDIKQWIDRGIIDDETLEKFDLMEVNVVKQRDGMIKSTLCRHIKHELRFVEIQPIRR